MINAKEYYYICDDVRDSIKGRAELDSVNLIPFGAGEIAGFIICDDCLGPEPEVENFFDQISPGLQEYRFKKRKKLRAWAKMQNIRMLPFSEMQNSWWAGASPQPGDKVNHCCECQEAPVAFIIKFEFNPLDLLELEELKAKGEEVIDPSEAPDYFLLCGLCYETFDPDDLMDDTDQSIFDDEMQNDLNSKVCSYMNFDTYHQRLLARNLPSHPDVGDLVAACDHMIEEPEYPLHYWHVAGAGIQLTVEDDRGREEKKTIQWLQHCNQCNILYSGAEAVLDNAFKEKFHITWTEDDNEIFPIDAPDAEEDTTDY
jgi:hypothetical protein